MQVRPNKTKQLQRPPFLVKIPFFILAKFGKVPRP
jgi:hypothetical protein